MSIRHQLIFILILIIIILVILMNFSFLYNSKIIEKKMIDFNNQINVQVDEKMENFIKTEDVYMRSFVNNFTLQEYFERTRDKDFALDVNSELLADLKRTAVRHMISNSNVYDIIITDNRGNTIFYYCSDKNIKKLQNTISNLSTGIIYDNSNYMYTVSKPVIRKEGPQVGTVTFVFYMSSLKEIFGDNMRIGDIRYYLINNENRILSGPEDINIGQKAERQILKAIRSSDRQLNDMMNGKNVLIQAKTVSAREWVVASVVPIDDLMYGVLQIRYSTIIIWCACILIIIVIYGLFFRKLTQSVSHLLSIMKLVQLGDFQIRAKSLQNRELNLLSQGFNKMMDRIVELTGENSSYQQELYEVEISNRQAKLKALQSQINPHFLYNTLEIMKSIGVYHGIKEIQEISTSLAYMFKYSIKEGDMVRVSEEIQTVMRYLSIQQIRFMDKIEVDIQIDEQVLHSVMLKFLFQPIVENSIFHGLEQKPGKGYIRIRAEYDESIIRFIIEDTGVGIEEPVLQRIRENMERGDFIEPRKRSADGGVGLVNIHNRIRLFYGNDYGLRIDSKINIGTTVTIEIPMSRGGHHV